eukprot:gene1393-1588_t
MLASDLLHPPWHAQLFLADLITGALMTHVKACEEGREGTAKDIFTFPYVAKQYPPYKTMEEVAKALPASPVAHLKSTGCPAGAAKFVDIDAHYEFYSTSQSSLNVTVSSVSKTTSTTTQLHSGYTPKGAYTIGWRLVEERRGKPGWVSSFPTSYDGEPTVHIPIQNVSNLYTQSFGFILKIEFLMTYFNAGVVDVLLCGKSMGTVDSLWSDRKLRMSVSKSAFFTVCNKWCSSTENVTFDIDTDNGMLFPVRTALTLTTQTSYQDMGTVTVTVM